METVESSLRECVRVGRLAENDIVVEVQRDLIKIAVAWNYLFLASSMTCHLYVASPRDPLTSASHLASVL